MFIKPFFVLTLSLFVIGVFASSASLMGPQEVSAQVMVQPLVPETTVSCEKLVVPTITPVFEGVQLKCEYITDVAHISCTDGTSYQFIDGLSTTC